MKIDSDMESSESDHAAENGSQTPQFAKGVGKFLLWIIISAALILGYVLATKYFNNVVDRTGGGQSAVLVAPDGQVVTPDYNPDANDGLAGEPAEGDSFQPPTSCPPRTNTTTIEATAQEMLDVTYAAYAMGDAACLETVVGNATLAGNLIKDSTYFAGPPKVLSVTPFDGASEGLFWMVEFEVAGKVYEDDAPVSMRDDFRAPVVPGSNVVFHAGLIRPWR